MAESEMVITLRLDDKASKELAKAMKDIGLSAEDTAKVMNKLGEQGSKETIKQKNALQQASTALRGFRSQLLVVSLAIGAMSAATKEWGNRNKETRESLDELGIAGKNILALAGKFSPLLMIIKATSGAVKEFNTAMAGGDIGTDLNRASAEIKNFNEDLKNQLILFQTGRTSPEEYYRTLAESQNSTITANQQISQQLGELAALNAEVSNRDALEFERVTSEKTRLLNEYKSNYMTAHAGMEAFTVTLSQSIKTNLSSAMSGVITGAQTAKEAFSQLGKAMIQTVVDFMVQKVVASVLEKTLLAGTVAASVVAGTAVATAWAPAAALVSLATFGANAAPAAAGIASVNALTAGMIKVTSVMSGGGKVLDKAGFAVGTPNVPTDMMAQVHQGETIIPATFAESIRRGELSLSGGGGGAGGGDISIALYGVTINSKENVRELAEELGFEIDRKFRNARSRV